MIRFDRREAYMGQQSWESYDKVDRIGLCEIVKPLPGWRVDRVYADGTIGDYRDDGTRRALCRKKQFVLAVVHDLDCVCGYRILNDVYTLLQYVEVQGRTVDVNLAAGVGWKGRHVGLVLTRVLGSGLAAPITDPTDPPGTVRVTNTRLAEVFLPTNHFENALPAGMARKIRNKYGVTVQHMPGDLYSFQGSPDTVPPIGWPEECLVPSNSQETTK